VLVAVGAAVGTAYSSKSSGIAIKIAPYSFNKYLNSFFFTLPLPAAFKASFTLPKISVILGSSPRIDKPPASENPRCCLCTNPVGPAISIDFLLPRFKAKSPIDRAIRALLVSLGLIL
jgi:hypothetical protein